MPSNTPGPKGPWSLKILGLQDVRQNPGPHRRGGQLTRPARVAGGWNRRSHANSRAYILLTSPIYISMPFIWSSGRCNSDRRPRRPSQGQGSRGEGGGVTGQQLGSLPTARAAGAIGSPGVLGAPGESQRSDSDDEGRRRGQGGEVGGERGNPWVRAGGYWGRSSGGRGRSLALGVGGRVKYRGRPDTSPQLGGGSTYKSLSGPAPVGAPERGGYNALVTDWTGS